MSLLEIVNALARPPADDGVFTASTLGTTKGVRVGVDAAGRPGLFFETTSPTGRRTPYVLAALTYAPSERCWFSGDHEEHQCAVLRCTSSEPEVRQLFLRIVDSWLPTAPTSGIGVEIDASVSRLVGLFHAIERPARGDVLGLWGELFVILSADDPSELLRAWRCDPFELHDFVSGTSRLEVKTTTVGTRRHHFSLQQLQIPVGTRLVVSSVVTKPSTRGQTVEDLRLRLVAQLKDARLAFRVDETIAQTLGERWTETTSERFLWEEAARSLAFYDGTKIPSVGPVLPPEVSDVRFSVELSGLTEMGPDTFPGIGNRSGLKRYLVSRASSD